VTDLKDFNIHFANKIIAKELVLDYEAEDLNKYQMAGGESLKGQLVFIMPELRKVSLKMTKKATLS